MSDEEGQNGPPKVDTTYAKKHFELETSDIAKIQGFRREGGVWGGGAKLTVYYVSDLTALAIEKHGQEKFDTHVLYGRKLSGRHGSFASEVKEAKEQQQEQVRRDQAGGIVPPERLCNLFLKQLVALLVRLEGGKLLPYCVSKDACIARILAAGYDVEAEAAHKRKEEEERVALKAAQERKAEEAKVQREAAAALKAAKKERALAISLSKSKTQTPEKSKKEALPARPAAG